MALNLTGGKKAFELMIDNFAKSLTRTAATKTTDNDSGDETLTDGASSTISGAFYKAEDYYNQDKEALFNGADAVVLVKTAVTVNKNDKLAYGGETYRVREVEQRYLATTTFYKVARCFKIA